MAIKGAEAMNHEATAALIAAHVKLAREYSHMAVMRKRYRYSKGLVRAAIDGRDFHMNRARALRSA